MQFNLVERVEAVQAYCLALRFYFKLTYLADFLLLSDTTHDCVCCEERISNPKPKPSLESNIKIPFEITQLIPNGN